MQLRIAPRASRVRVGGVQDDRLKISLTAPPVGGKANQQLVRFAGKQFGVAPSHVTVVSGVSSRDKTLRINQPNQLPPEFRIER